MKTSKLKEVIVEAYIDIIFFVIGLAALFSLGREIHALGFGIFSVVPQKPFEYAKPEFNIFNLLLFTVISVSGIAYGVFGIFKCFNRHKD